ncbi:nuclear transport factor 2 family protein [Alteromonas gilva]|uniref:Nuclear transport factor 2 family protein n=1 Tax=Alteromonas gilva TaxID=2987522 RepID=A0ABT5L0T7_9ALTE|nr:nuclear transport factor 2 family protein [Alteromonas gilva]MDC8830659.1 nuclear transport factor 2 family protein [Alteromonas gilva]
MQNKKGKSMLNRILISSILFAVLATPTVARADDKADLQHLLDEFLTGQTQALHEQFWADDLVYTSSNGTRFGKAEIMAGFKSSEEQNAQQTEDTPSMTFSGTDVDIRLYDDMAIVAFKLIANQAGKVFATYLNTGTFQKRSGKWKAIAWQATKVP